MYTSIAGRGMVFMGGVALIENPYLVETEVYEFPERQWWRRWYRVNRVDLVTWPSRELFVIKQSLAGPPAPVVIGHPAVISRLRAVLEVGGSWGYAAAEAREGSYHPVKVIRYHVYNWAWVCWIIVWFVLAVIVLLVAS